MAFKFTSEHLYWWPVKISVPHPEHAGTWLRQEFKARFALIPQDEADAIVEELRALPADEAATRGHALILRAMRDWKDVTDDDGQPVPFSAGALLQAMQSSWFRIGLYRAWNESLLPDEARRKN